jgi:hypothetical protein
MSKWYKAVHCDIGGNAIDGMALPTFDYTAQVQTATADTWTFYVGGSGGVLVATITINYTDATKAIISNVVRT